jgi:hypothetical protein
LSTLYDYVFGAVENDTNIIILSYYVMKSAEMDAQLHAMTEAQLWDAFRYVPVRKRNERKAACIHDGSL